MRTTISLLHIRKRKGVNEQMILQKQEEKRISKIIIKVCMTLSQKTTQTLHKASEYWVF